MNCEHCGDKVEDSFSKKLDDILGITHTNCPYVKPCPVESQSKRAIIQAILDELPEDIEPKRGRDSLSPLDIMHNLTLEELRKKFSNE